MLHPQHTHVHTASAAEIAWSRQLSKTIFVKLTFNIGVDITDVIAFPDLWEEWESGFTLASVTIPQIQKVTTLLSFADLLRMCVAL